MTPRQVSIVCLGLILAAASNHALAARDTKMTVLKASTAIYDVFDDKGKKIGVIERYSNDWGRHTVEKRNVTMSVMGMTIPNESYMITRCSKLYAVSADGTSATETENPMWQGMENAIKQKGPQAAGKEMMTSVGFTRTDKSCSHQKLSGTVYSNPNLGGDANACVDEKNGILLESYVNMGGFVSREVLREFSKDAGPADAYQVPAKITQGPDLNKLGSLGNMQGNANSSGQGQPEMPEGFDMEALKKQMEALQKQLGGQTE